MNNGADKIKDFYENWEVENLPKYIKILMELEEKLIVDIITNLEDFNNIKKKKNAVILAHNYVTMDVQNVADFVGDSLALAQKAKEVEAD